MQEVGAMKGHGSGGTTLNWAARASRLCKTPTAKVKKATQDANKAP